MKARIVGSIEVAYQLLGMHNHQASRQVTYVPLNLQQDEQRGIRSDVQDPNIPGSSREIFKKNIIARYDERVGPSEVQSLLLMDFVLYYYSCTKDRDKAIFRAKTMDYIVQPEENRRLPIAIISQDQVYRLQQTRRRFTRYCLVNVMSDLETYYCSSICAKSSKSQRSLISQQPR